jgi:hypothetical protein
VALNTSGFNCIRVLSCDKDYVVEGGNITFGGSDNTEITYIKDITDTTLLSVGFVNSLVVYIAYLLSTKLTQSDSNLSVITTTKCYISTLNYIFFITRQNSNTVESSSIKRHMAFTSIIGT